jgi:CubicO group peptidase (beta-lactamase class C family)
MEKIKAGINRLLGAFALLVIVVAGCAAQTVNGNQELTARVDEYVNALVKQHRFSGSILPARDGKVLLSKGYGMANLEDETPNTPQGISRAINSKSRALSEWSSDWATLRPACRATRPFV